MSELYILASVITLFVALGLNVVISQNPVYSILYLVLFFVSGSSILVLFGFDYLALIFVLVYVGAIAVLFLFVIMILDIKIINKPGFDATVFVALSFILFLFPIFYWISAFIASLNFFVVNNFIYSPLSPHSWIFKYTFIEDTFLLLESGIWPQLIALGSYPFALELNLWNSQLFILYLTGFYDSFVLLKMFFCEHGFSLSATDQLLSESSYLFKIDYDSSVKNFQILYTDFTSLFIISGGVLLVAMTSCISLALPSRQYNISSSLVRRRFKEE